MTEVFADARPAHWLRGLVLGLTLVAGTAQGGTAAQQQLDELPQRWARAASAGDVEALMALYASEAYIHVVFTQEELRGEKQIRDYYGGYSQQKPRVTITGVDENSILNDSIGILSGYAKVEFPGREPMATHFSIVGKWQQNRWEIQMQTTVRVDQRL